MLNIDYITLKAKRIEIIQRFMLTGLKTYELENLDEKIQEIRKNCQHEFKDGQCIYCELERGK